VGSSHLDTFYSSRHITGLLQGFLDKACNYGSYPTVLDLLSASSDDTVVIISPAQAHISIISLTFAILSHFSFPSEVAFWIL
jgi:hypothetical protein